jgi:2-polyprenyl-3-methyl-5-hydroxy-6-metoxy-1,4-benzoquinol methylase
MLNETAKCKSQNVKCKNQLSAQKNPIKGALLTKLRYFFRQIILPYSFIIDLVKKYSTQKEVLDIGAGTGFVLQQLIDNQIIIKGVGTEIDEKYFVKKEHFEITSIENIVKPFEIILLIDVLHHVTEKEIFLTDIATKCSQKGTFLIVKEMSPQNFIFRSWNTLHDIIFNHQIPCYISPSALSLFLEKQGFSVVENFSQRIFLYDHYFQVYQKV